MSESCLCFGPSGLGRFISVAVLCFVRFVPRAWVVVRRAFGISERASRSSPRASVACRVLVRDVGRGGTLVGLKGY